MFSKLNERIEYELNQLHKLLEEGRNIIDSSRSVAPDVAGRWALGAMLQAFYNGIENIFKQIAVACDGNLAKSERWHADLLILMAHETPKHLPVVSPELYAVLRKYLGFRHIFRSIYTHELRWESMADLVLQAESTLTMLEKEICDFIDKSTEAKG